MREPMQGVDRAKYDIWNDGRCHGLGHGPIGSIGDPWCSRLNKVFVFRQSPKVICGARMSVKTALQGCRVQQLHLAS